MGTFLFTNWKMKKNSLDILSLYICWIHTLSTILFPVRDTLADWLSILFSMYESVTLLADKKIHNIAVVVGPKRSLINWRLSDQQRRFKRKCGQNINRTIFIAILWVFFLFFFVSLSKAWLLPRIYIKNNVGIYFFYICDIRSRFSGRNGSSFYWWFSHHVKSRWIISKILTHH